MSLNRRIDTEDMVHIYNGILMNNAVWSHMDGPTDCHAEWSKSGREIEISYDNPNMWNLKINDTHVLIYITETGT